MNALLLESINLALGLVFALAASAKLRHPRRFVLAVRGLALVPPALASLVAVTAIAAEAALAAGHLAGMALQPVAALGLVTAGAMMAGLTVLLRRGTNAACFCFGSNGTERIGPRTLARASLLAAGETLLLVSGVTASAFAAQALVVALLVIGITGWVLAGPEALLVLRSRIPAVRWQLSVSECEVDP